MTWIPKNGYINKLNGIVLECNITYHSKIKMKPVCVCSSTYIQFSVKNNDKDPKFYVSDHVRESKYTNILAKDCAPNWSEEVFICNKVKSTVRWTYIIVDLNREKIAAAFCKKDLQNAKQE